MAPHDLEFLRNLPVRRGVTWQGGLRRLPLWVTPEGAPPFRPRAAVWSSSIGKVHMGDAVEPANASANLVIDAFVAFARHKVWGGYLPARVEVADSAEAALLEPALTQLGVSVGVTRRLRHGLVLGAGGEEFGLMLFDSPRLVEAMRRQTERDPFERDSAWCVFFGPVNEAPLGDADLFEDHGFPVAASDAYPWPALLGSVLGDDFAPDRDVDMLVEFEAGHVPGRDG